MREAIISLELSGVVEVRVGTGIFVRDAATRAGVAGRAGAADSGPGPFEVLSARAVIEGETAALAAGSRSRADVDALRSTVEQMRAHDDDPGVRDAADREFHERIAAATGNSALAWVVGTLWDQRHGDLWARIESHFHTPALRARTLLDHQAVVDAIDAQDAHGAREAMRRHLSRVAQEFQRRIDAADGDDARGTDPLPRPARRRAPVAARKS